MPYDAGSIVATADLDLSPFRRGLEHAKAEARKFADERYTTTIDLDTKRSSDELAAVEQRLHGIEQIVDRVNRKSTNSGGGGGGFLGALSRAGGHAPSFRALGIGAALPLAGPLGGAALGAGASLLTPALAGGIGLGIFGAAAKSSITKVQGDVSQLTKLTQRYNAAATDKQRAAALTAEQRLWRGLDPAQRGAVKNVQALESSWSRFQKKLEPQSFGALAGGAKIANTGLNYLLPTARAVGNEIESLEKRAEHAFTQPWWHQFFGTFLPGEARRSVDVFGTALGHMLSGGAHLMQDFAPLGHDLEGVIGRLSSKFDVWAQGGGPVKFVNWAEREGPVAEQALLGLAHGLEGFGKGLAPLGQVELRALTPILNFIGDLGNEHPEVITAIGGSLLALGGGLKVIQGASTLKNILGDAGQLSGFRQSILGVAGAVGAFSIGEATSGRGGAAGAAEGTLGGALSGLAAGLAVGGPFGAALGAAGGAVLGLTGHLLGAEGATDKANKAIQNWMKTAYQADNFKVGQQFNQGIVSSLQQSPSTSSIFATAGVKVGQIASSIESQNAIGGPAGLQLQAAARAGKISQRQYQQGVTALQTLVTNFGSVVTDLDNIAIITGRTSQHLNLLAADAKKLADVVFAQPGPKIPGLPHLPSSPSKPPTLLNLLTPPGAHRAAGGPVSAGMSYLVGEQGPELFTPHAAGAITTSSRTSSLIGRQLAAAVGASFGGFSTAFERLFTATVDKQLNALGGRLNNAANQYRSDLSARASLASQISGGIMSSGSIANASLSNTGGATVGGFLAGQISQDRQFSAAIAKLRARHLDPRLLQQITDAGPQQGLILAQQILSGESIGGLNKQEKTLAGLAGGIGSNVAGAAFSGTLSGDARQIARLATAAEKLLSKQLHLSASSQRALAREIATEFNHAMPYLNLKALGHARAIRIYAS